MTKVTPVDVVIPAEDVEVHREGNDIKEERNGLRLTDEDQRLYMFVHMTPFKPHIKERLTAVLADDKRKSGSDRCFYKRMQNEHRKYYREGNLPKVKLIRRENVGEESNEDGVSLPAGLCLNEKDTLIYRFVQNENYSRKFKDSVTAMLLDEYKRGSGLALYRRLSAIVDDKTSQENSTETGNKRVTFKKDEYSERSLMGAKSLQETSIITVLSEDEDLMVLSDSDDTDCDPGMWYIKQKMLTSPTLSTDSFDSDFSLVDSLHSDVPAPVHVERAKKSRKLEEFMDTVMKQEENVVRKPVKKLARKPREAERSKKSRKLDEFMDTVMKQEENVVRKPVRPKLKLARKPKKIGRTKPSEELDNLMNNVMKHDERSSPELINVRRAEQSEKIERIVDSAIKHDDEDAVVVEKVDLPRSEQSEKKDQFMNKLMNNEMKTTLSVMDLLLPTVQTAPEHEVLRTVNSYIHRGGKIRTIRDNSQKTLLHHSVKRNQRDVASLLLEHEVDPMAEDEDGLIPLRYALNNKLDDMGALIVSKTQKSLIVKLFSPEYGDPFRRIYIQEILDPTFEKTLLAVLDAMNEEGTNGIHSITSAALEADECGALPYQTHKFNAKSDTAFQHLAYTGRKDVLCHPVLRAVIDDKWKRWAGLNFLIYAGSYLLSLFCLTFAIVTASTTDDVFQYDTSLQHARAVFEIIAYISAIIGLAYDVFNMIRHKVEFTQMSNYIDILSSILIIIALPVRYTHVHVHWYILAFGYLLWVFRIFNYTVYFSGIGIYSEALRQTVLQDFGQFFCIFAVILLAFSGTVMLVMKGDDGLNITTEISSFHGILYVGLRTMIEAGTIIDYTEHRPMTAIVMLGFLFVTIVIMLNFLIAQLSNTYGNIQGEAVKSVIANRAWIIARLEKRGFLCRKPGSTPGVISVDLSLLYPRVQATVADKLDVALGESKQRQVENGLQIQTIKNRLTTYSTNILTEINTSIQKLELLISEQNEPWKHNRKGSPLDLSVRLPRLSVSSSFNFSSDSDSSVSSDSDSDEPPAPRSPTFNTPVGGRHSPVGGRHTPVGGRRYRKRHEKKKVPDL